MPGAAVGAAAGGIQGALTNDPNNPNEGRMGRIVSGALGGAAMGAGAGGAFGAGKAHIGNLTRAAKQQGRVRANLSAGAAMINDYSKGITSFGRGGQWKTSSSSFWSGFVNRANGVF
jgi:hypothetical protein